MRHSASRAVLFFLCSLSLFISTFASASLEQQRNKFIQAEKLYKANKISQYKKLKTELKDYPLLPYLDYQEINGRLTSSNSVSVSKFIEQYPDLPISDRLNRRWLNHLIKTKKWAAYRKHYAKHPVAHIHYECQNQTALLNGTTKQKKAALYQAKTLWMVGNSQPKACDPLFKAWMATGRPTSKEAIGRFWLSIEQGNIKLAQYLTKKIKNKKLKAQAELFWSIYNNPEKVESTLLKKLPKVHQSKTAQLSYKRWYRQKAITATNSWIKHRDSLVPKEEQLNVSEYMGIRLNRNYHSQAIKLSQRLDPDYQSAELTETRIRNALAKQDWLAVKQGVKHLPAEEAKDPKWQYWAIIADRHLDPQNSHKEEIKALAEDRSFYGFVAAELNNTPFRMNAKSDAISDLQLEELSQLPAAARAGELFKLGRLTEANREWRTALGQMNEEEIQLAGYLARSWGWHLQAIINAAKTERWDHIDLRFPHPHAKLFEMHAEKNNLDLSFPVAIARQESAFLFNAQSRVGARGLMQLMPRTAKQTAKKHKVPYKKISELYNPETNITLGSAYLGDMLKRFDNNPAYAAAAYNAGPHRVKKWLKQRGHLPLDVWIETIPFKETRKYVQNVLAFRVIYDRLEGRQPSLLSEKQVQLLALNQSKRTAL
ncbi:transglycosylase SLT domain-containing protein [Neptuniibacter caesariensis]|uniref:Soluble lytic murein transglycosylase, putative n=1 Tax=Neptuniibacter caesariensis TaxID=207954 RepID=A0A7U8C8C0_NEPCE|nr:transglycosylase SLT domain-containing protein [Neptuniibacter caesariensis]EAR61714.1 soluble lytic murein transglycosylase, putative [Neptuniibacter caesariensis]